MWSARVSKQKQKGGSRERCHVSTTRMVCAATCVLYTRRPLVAYCAPCLGGRPRRAPGAAASSSRWPRLSRWSSCHRAQAHTRPCSPRPTQSATERAAPPVTATWTPAATPPSGRRSSHSGRRPWTLWRRKTRWERKATALSWAVNTPGGRGGGKAACMYCSTSPRVYGSAASVA